MNTVHLHGRLGKDFGDSYQLEIDDAKEAIRALCSQLPGFAETIREGNWRVVRGDLETGMDLDEESLDLRLGDKPVHIIPVAEGAGGDGVGKIIVGGLLIASAFFTGGATLAIAMGAAGAGLMVAGVTMMLTPTPETGDYEDKQKNEQSYLFDGPVNVNKQGVAVPLIYGETMTGSVVISAGIRAEDIPIGGSAADTIMGIIGKGK